VQFKPKSILPNWFGKVLNLYTHFSSKNAFIWKKNSGNSSKNVSLDWPASAFILRIGLFFQYDASFQMTFHSNPCTCIPSFNFESYHLETKCAR